jgi:hypothetical protein
MWAQRWVEAEKASLPSFRVNMYWDRRLFIGVVQRESILLSDPADKRTLVAPGLGVQNFGVHSLWAPISCHTPTIGHCLIDCAHVVSLGQT